MCTEAIQATVAFVQKTQNCGFSNIKMQKKDFTLIWELESKLDLEDFKTNIFEFSGG
jgi:hypothetical protein